MPSAVIPPEVWSRIFFFVAPPLPYVGLEHESFAEDAKVWRGDEDAKGRWKDIDALMLVSKRVNELVAPVFWSYIVLTSAEGFAHLAEHLAEQSDETGSLILSSVKVLKLLDGLAAEKARHFCLSVIRDLSKLVHIHLHSDPPTPTSPLLLACLATRAEPVHGPLQGLTGLVLGDDNFEAATLAVRNLAPSLRRLSVLTIESEAPSSAHSSYASIQSVSFPYLFDIQTGSHTESGHAWLEVTLADRWDVPAAAKIGVGIRTKPSSALGTAALVHFSESAVKRLFLPTLLDVADGFTQLVSLQVSELAVEIGASVGGGGTHTEFKATLDSAIVGAICSIRVVVVVEGLKDRTPQDEEDACLVELVNHKRFPLLNKVVWIAARPHDSNAHWPALLVKWSHALLKAGIDFQVQ